MWTLAVSGRSVESESEFKYAFDVVFDAWFQHGLTVGVTYTHDQTNIALFGISQT